MASFEEGILESLSPIHPAKVFQLDPVYGCCLKPGEEVAVKCAWATDGTFVWSMGKFVFSISTKDERKEAYERLKTRSLSDCNFQVFEAAHPITSIAVGCRDSDKKWHSGQVAYNRLQNFPNGRLVIAAGLSNGDITVWNSDSGKIVLLLRDHKAAVTDLSFARDGSLVLASCAKDGYVKLWDLMDDGNMFRTLEGHPKAVLSLAWSPDNCHLASVGVGKTVMLWNARTEKLERRLEGHQNDVTSCAFSPDGSLLFTASCDTTVICWDVKSGAKRSVYRHMFPPPRPIFAGGANGHEVRNITVSSDGLHFATSCHDGYLRIWNIMEAVPIRTISLQDQRAIKFSADGFLLALCTRDGSLSFFESPMEVQSLKHLARIVANRAVGSMEESSVEAHLPWRLSDFLKYPELQ